MYEVFAAVSRGEAPQPPKEIAPDLPDVVASIISCAMERDRALRYQNMRDFVADMETYLAEESGDVTMSVTYQTVGKDKSTARFGKGKYRFEKLMRQPRHTAFAKPAVTRPVPKKTARDPDATLTAAASPARPASKETQPRPGADVQATLTDKKPAATPPVPAKRLPFPWIPVGIAAALVLILTAGLFYGMGRWGKSDGPKAVAREFGTQPQSAGAWRPQRVSTVRTWRLTLALRAQGRAAM